METKRRRVSSESPPVTDSPPVMDSHLGGLLRVYPSLLLKRQIERAQGDLFGVTLVDSPPLDKGDGPFLWRRPPIVVHGRPCRQRRSVGFFVGDKAVRGYAYSGRVAPAQPMAGLPVLEQLLGVANRALEGTKSVKFNSALVNSYADGSDYISAHSDDVTHLVKPAVVAAFSFGASRTFRVRDKRTKKVELDVPLDSGSFLVMMPGFQARYTHEVPKTAPGVSRRVSVTFREHLPQRASSSNSE